MNDAARFSISFSFSHFTLLTFSAFYKCTHISRIAFLWPWTLSIEAFHSLVLTIIHYITFQSRQKPGK